VFGPVSIVAWEWDHAHVRHGNGTRLGGMGMSLV